MILDLDLSLFAHFQVESSVNKWNLKKISFPIIAKQLDPPEHIKNWIWKDLFPNETRGYYSGRFGSHVSKMACQTIPSLQLLMKQR
jgi:hypothetical protein